MKQQTLINKEMTTVDKLNRLLSIVENIPNDQFDMRTWHEKTRCGTVGCALGWACLDPVFNKMGLGLVEKRRNYPSYEGEEDYRAGEKFFGITENEAEYIFDFASYDDSWEITKQEVIERIKEVRDKYKNT